MSATSPGNTGWGGLHGLFPKAVTSGFSSLKDLNLGPLYLMFKPSLCVWTPSLEQRFGPAAAAVGDVCAVLTLALALASPVYFFPAAGALWLSGWGQCCEQGWLGRQEERDHCFFHFLFFFFLISGFIKASSISSQIQLEHL